MPSNGFTRWCQRITVTDYQKAVFVCFMTYFSTAYTSVYPFTYLPDMILYFGYEEAEKGFYAGLVASAYFTGSVLFSYLWGWLSDRYGRRLVLTFLLFATGLFCFLYGFCADIFTAVIIRFCDGAVNGVAAVVSAILYDHSNDGNQAFAASIVACAWGVGMCLGPLIGGYLSKPATKYPETFDIDGLFGKFPFLIPSFIGCITSFVAVLVVFFILPTPVSRNDNSEIHSETRYIELNEQTPSEDITDYDTAIESFEYEPAPSHHIESHNMGTANIQIPTERTRQENEKSPLFRNEKDKKPHVYLTNLITKLKTNSLYVILKYPGVPLMLLANMLFHLTAIGNWELLPVWLSTTRDLGGLGFTSDQIGLFTGTVSIIGIVLQSFIVVLLERRIGAISSYMVFAFGICVSVQLITMSRLVHNHAAMWSIIYLNNTVLSTGFTAGLAVLTVITNNCAPLEHVGALNGLTQTLAGIFRAIAPVVGGNIFAASIGSSVGPPIDVSLAFVFFGFSMWLSIIAAYFLPRHLNSQVSR